MQMIFATQRRTGKHRHFRRMHDKKVNVLALAAIIGAPDTALPAEVAAGAPQLMAGLLRLLVALKQQQVCKAVWERTSRTDTKVCTLTTWRPSSARRTRRCRPTLRPCRSLAGLLRLLIALTQQRVVSHRLH